MLSNRSTDLMELLHDFSTAVAAITLKNNLSSFAPVSRCYTNIYLGCLGVTNGKQQIRV